MENLSNQKRALVELSAPIYQMSMHSRFMMLNFFHGLGRQSWSSLPVCVFFFEHLVLLLHFKSVRYSSIIVSLWHATDTERRWHKIRCTFNRKSPLWHRFSLTICIRSFFGVPISTDAAAQSPPSTLAWLHLGCCLQFVRNLFSIISSQIGCLRAPVLSL